MYYEARTHTLLEVRDALEAATMIKTCDLYSNNVLTYQGTRKTFFWKDKTGRGYTETYNQMNIPNEQPDDDGLDASDWADQAEVGDEWETQTDHFICTKIDDRMLYNVISPDGIEIHPFFIYESLKQAKRAFKEWKKKFEKQGYYSYRFQQLPLKDLHHYCYISDYDNHCNRVNRYDIRTLKMIE